MMKHSTCFGCPVGKSSSDFYDYSSEGFLVAVKQPSTLDSGLMVC